ncbi:hypothetical protein RFI_06596, partial [Reticulomyxa filosa]
ENENENENENEMQHHVTAQSSLHSNEDDLKSALPLTTKYTNSNLSVIDQRKTNEEMPGSLMGETMRVTLINMERQRSKTNSSAPAAVATITTHVPVLGTNSIQCPHVQKEDSSYSEEQDNNANKMKPKNASVAILKTEENNNNKESKHETHHQIGNSSRPGLLSIGITSFHLSLYLLFPVLCNQVILVFAHYEYQEHSSNLLIGIALLWFFVIITFVYIYRTRQLASHIQMLLQEQRTKHWLHKVYDGFYFQQTCVHQDMSSFFIQQISSPKYWYYGFIPLLLLLFVRLCCLFLKQVSQVILLSVIVAVLIVEGIMVVRTRPYLIKIDRKCQLFWRCLT